MISAFFYQTEHMVLGVVRIQIAVGFPDTLFPLDYNYSLI